MPGSENIPDILNADRDRVLRHSQLRPTEVIVIDNDEVIISFSFKFKFVSLFNYLVYICTV